jgi:hypothetical protein
MIPCAKNGGRSLRQGFRLAIGNRTAIELIFDGRDRLYMYEEARYYPIFDTRKPG